ncbi:MAG: M56 family metallopeptidase [Actinoallomurus sp.]
MTGTALLALVAAGSALGAHRLTRAQWTWRTPRTAILLWQALGLAWGLASIGTLLGFGVAPYGQGVILGIARFFADPQTLSPIRVASVAGGLTFMLLLIAMLLVAIVGVVRARRRHRALLALVAHGDPEVPGTLVLDHPAAAAYCVPGVRSSKVVVSAGTLEILGPYELAAVLDHERAHVRERHDLVLLPFTSLRRVFPQARIVGRTLDAVELLVEMAADDRARRHRPAKELATALLRFAAARPAPSPAGTLAIAGDETSPIVVRVRRLISPAPLPRPLRGAMLAAATLVAVLPLILYTIPA